MFSEAQFVYFFHDSAILKFWKKNIFHSLKYGSLFLEIN